MITVIGIGMKKGDITLAAHELISTCKCAFVRSAKTIAGKAALSAYPYIIALDDCFESVNNFDEWCDAVCARLTEAEKTYGDVLYLTDGDGFGDSAACKLSLQTEVKFAGGVAQCASRGASASVLQITASDAVARRPYLDTSVSLHVTEIDDALVAGDLKLWLMEYYGAETVINVSVRGKDSKIELLELDRMSAYDYTCEIFVPAAEGFRKSRYSFGDLQRIMHRLTAPDGCPWDKVQTHESVRINMIEEAYEAVDAIDSGDLDAQIEELGDVILQSVLHCDIGRRHGEYDMPEVLDALCAKLVSRHTHIFGSLSAANPDEALRNWEAAKSEEKSYTSLSDKLNRLPRCFPALLAAEKVYRKLLKAGAGTDATYAEVRKCAVGTEEECARKLFRLTAAMSDNGIDAENVLSSYVSNIKRLFEEAEKSGDIAGFLDKI